MAESATIGPEVTTIDPTEKPRRQRRPRTKKEETKEKKPLNDVDEASLAALHNVVVVAVSGACLFVPPHLRPTEQEVHAIFIPAERIYLRHAGMPKVNPDAADYLAIFIGLSNYAMRVGQMARLPQVDMAGVHQRAQQAPSGTINTPTEVVPPGHVEVPGVGYVKAETAKSNGNGASVPNPEPIPTNVVNLQEGERWADTGEGTGINVDKVRSEALERGEDPNNAVMLALWNASKTDTEDESIPEEAL